jgi:hypothetical protein
MIMLSLPLFCLFPFLSQVVLMSLPHALPRDISMILWGFAKLGIPQVMIKQSLKEKT